MADYYNSLELLRYCDCIDEVGYVELKYAQNDGERARGLENQQGITDADQENKAQDGAAIKRGRKRSSSVSSVSSTYTLPEIEDDIENYDSILNKEISPDATIVGMNKQQQLVSLQRLDEPASYQEVPVAATTTSGYKKKQKKHQQQQQQQHVMPSYFDTMAYMQTSTESATTESIRQLLVQFKEAVVDAGLESLNTKKLFGNEQFTRTNNEVVYRIIQRKHEQRQSKVKKVNLINAKGVQGDNDGADASATNGKKDPLLTVENYTEALTALLSNKKLNLPPLTPAQIDAIAKNPTFQNNQMITNFLKLTMKNKS